MLNIEDKFMLNRPGTFEMTGIKTYNWYEAIRGMRNPLMSHKKMDSKINDNGKFIMGEKDKKLALNLATSGSDHGKFLRQIKVSIRVLAPWYWWKEYATYKVSTVENSSSMMHLLGNRTLNKSDFAWDKMTDFRRYFIEHINRLIKRYHQIQDELEEVIDKLPNSTKDSDVNDSLFKSKESLKKAKKEVWRELNQDMNSSWLYFRTCTLNYEVLRNIYHSRFHHKLHEWHFFCEMIEDLPYSEFITKPRR